jgi:hypothetical protein
MTNAKPLARRVYDEFHAIDCRPFVKKKNGLDYVPWAVAWALVLDRFPETEDPRRERVQYEDGSWEVMVSVTIRDGDESITRSMWLPVMDYKNQPIANPTTRDFNDSYMRCLVKTLAMFGLGLNIYGGEINVPEPVVQEMANERQMAKIREYHEAGEIPDNTLSWLDKQEWQLTRDQAGKLLTKLKAAQKNEAA